MWVSVIIELLKLLLPTIKEIIINKRIEKIEALQKKIKRNE